MRVHDVLSDKVVTIGRHGSCHEAAARMHRHLPVGGEAGELVGVVTDRDLRHRLFNPADELPRSRVDHRVVPVRWP